MVEDICHWELTFQDDSLLSHVAEENRELTTVTVGVVASYCRHVALCSRRQYAKLFVEYD